MRSTYWTLIVGIILFCGCKTLEYDPEMNLSVTIPDSFTIDEKGYTKTIENWWFSFGSDELNGLIRMGIDNNFDLKIARARINQAKARVEKQNASFFPDLGFSVGGQTKKTQVKSKNTRSPVQDESNLWDASLSGSYTADVWGGAKAGKQARVSNRKAAQQDLNLSTMEVTAQIASIWIDIISVRNKKKILKGQIKINKTLLELQQLRFINGKANALDVSQQREVLAGANSQVPLLEKQEKLLLNNLALLLGKSVAENDLVNTFLLPEPLPLPRTGIPSDLLENRPDIKAARLRLSAALWEIKAAKADLLPSFSLTARALFSSGHLDLLFQNWIASLGASIAGPIFDGGFRKAEVQRVKAVAGEQLNLYAKKVAEAIIDVEDSLVSIQKQDSFIKLLEEELLVVRLTLKDAMIQYQNGQSSYLSYLMAWTSIEKHERQLVGERAIAVKERIGLYRALGWESVLEN